MEGIDLSGFAQWAFFNVLFDLVNGRIESFQEDLLSRTTSWVSGIALTLLTLWVLMQGFLIVTGRSRESLMGLVVGSLRATLIVLVAGTMATGGTVVTELLTDTMPNEIHQVVAGNDDDIEDAINQNLMAMGLIFALVDALPTESSQDNAEEQRTITSLTGIGIAGPSVIGAAMLLLYKIALVLFVGFGPLFILCLLFQPTRELFKRWLLYGIGTMFSMAVLSFMVSVATQVVALTAAAMVTSYGVSSALGLGVGLGGGLKSAAVQQGGVGLLMSVLMVMVPPIAAMFFNGTLGQFVANSSFGNVGRNSSGQRSDLTQPTVATKSNDEAK
ncbi:type IV secretion system protein [Stenotrophomonas maltophilia]|jgi:type IV secretion system protein VirB6|nr:type IV secretion system protein [Stenotrophomonas maltophilia]